MVEDLITEKVSVAIWSSVSYMSLYGWEFGINPAQKHYPKYFSHDEFNEKVEKAMTKPFKTTTSFKADKSVIETFYGNTMEKVYGKSWELYHEVGNEVWPSDFA